MNLREFIKKALHESVNNKKIWYHGTADSRNLEAAGGFHDKITSVEYVENPDEYFKHLANLQSARTEGNEKTYFQLLDKTSEYLKRFSYNSPVFLTDVHSVAKTYANPKRAFDYQGAIEKVYQVEVECNNVVTIIATGDRFRFIGIDKVKSGFINAGVPENTINRLIEMFNYTVSDNKGIKTDTIAAIGKWLNFDCIDVVGVLDSYQGGTTKSTVRMVLNPSKIKLL